MNDLVTLFQALADESRLRILNLLFQSGELCVCDIESMTGYTQTKVSRHLAYLRNAGLLDARQQGLWMLYKIAHPKDDHHKLMLKSLKLILDSHPAALRDTQELARNIRNGCCATFTKAKPHSTPVTFKLK